MVDELQPFIVAVVSVALMLTSFSLATTRSDVAKLTERIEALETQD